MLKTIIAQIAVVLRSRRGHHNLRVLVRFFVALAAMVAVYSVAFHVLMEREGQHHSWITGVYWTLTVMSTLGFGDITFHSDLGRLFSMVVLISGTIFLLVLLPFTFIEFFYSPWMEAQAASRAPRRLPAKTRGHVLLTHHDAVTSALIHRLGQYQVPYALLVPEMDEALRLHDLGLSVVVGDLDNPETWVGARADAAALVVSTATDVTNTSVAFTMRELAPEVPVLTSASHEDSVDVLMLAGSTEVLRPEEMIGGNFARRAVGGDAMSHVLGRFDELLIAEATAHRTPLVGKKLRVQRRLFEKLGVTVVGVWERGRFAPARGETPVQDDTMLLLAGTAEDFARYDEFFCIYNISIEPVVILGGGRVGRATAEKLKERDVDYRIVELLPELILDEEKYVLGSAADLPVLEKAGIRKTSTVIVTTHDDELNVYLTIYCRQLRPDIQILVRATHERHVATLYRAGADSVLSYASIGASEAMNLLQRRKILMVDEGLYLFELPVPSKLVGRTVAQCRVRAETGCSVVATRTESGMKVVSDPAVTLQADADVVLIGTTEAEERFLELYGRGGAKG